MASIFYDGNFFRFFSFPPPNKLLTIGLVIIHTMCGEVIFGMHTPFHAQAAQPRPGSYAGGKQARTIKKLPTVPYFAILIREAFFLCDGGKVCNPRKLDNE